MKAFATVAGLAVVALAVTPVRRLLLNWFTRINGTWVGVAPVPTAPPAGGRGGGR